MRIMETTDRHAEVVGIGEHTISNVPLSTVAGVVTTTDGDAVAIFHQYAHHGKGKTIHSVSQLEHFGLDVNDRSLKVRNGKQRIVTPDGHVIPLHIRDGLAYLDMHPPTDDELATLPHIVCTSDVEWDPKVLDNEVTSDDFAALGTHTKDGYDQRLTEDGMYTHPIYKGHHIIAHMSGGGCGNDATPLLASVPSLSDTADTVVERVALATSVGRKVTIQPADIELLKPRFGWLTDKVIQATLGSTTQLARNTYRLPFRKHFKSRFPALNVHRRNEPVATDTIWSDTPALHSGFIAAQVFVGRFSLVTDVYGMVTDASFVHVLEDNIRKRGAMDMLISDRAKAQVSRKVQDILRMYCIKDYQSEPHHQHQNYAENRIRTLKQYTNRVLDRSGAPANLWLLACEYVTLLLNLTACEAIGFVVPLQKLTGQTQDVSALLQFHFYEPVYYAVNHSFPAGGQERRGRWVGVAESVGDALTWKILPDGPHGSTLLFRSAVRSAAADATDRNLRADQQVQSSVVPVASPYGEGMPLSTTDKTLSSAAASRNVVLSRDSDIDPGMLRSPTFDLDDLVGRTYLMPPDQTGDQALARIVEVISDHADTCRKDVLFRVGSDGEAAEEVITYNQLLDVISRNHESDKDDPDKLWAFLRISGHQGPLSRRHPDFKGSAWNVKVEWENGTSSLEPLHMLAEDDPKSCAEYAKEHGLLDTPGWKRFKRLALQIGCLDVGPTHSVQIGKAARKAWKPPTTKIRFGVRVPNNVKEALRFDKEAGKDNWKEAMDLELSQIHGYETFTDLGKGAVAPEDYKRIRVHFVFDFKHDGRYKARLVAGGHLTDPPDDSTYSGVVSLRSLRLVLFAAELNGLAVHQADVGNAYLEAYTKEKVYIVADDSFGDLAGHTLLISRALYGLKSSGARWHDRFSDALREMKFTPSKADADVWMRLHNEKWEYICVYVDDLAVAMHDPTAFFDVLTSTYKFKLKGVGEISYHLGANFGRDKDGTLYMSSKKYIQKMMDGFERLFGEKPALKFTSPLESGDHPETDTSRLCTEAEIKTYQSLIGQLQWLVSIGRMDLTFCVMTMSRFRVAPRKGHLDRLKRAFGYVRKYPDGSLRFRTGLPDYSNIQVQEFDWMYTVYGDVKEQLPQDMPVPKGKPVIMSTYVDANLLHDMTTGRAATGILHMVNGTPIDYYSKRQATVETATYGSEFVAAKIATEQVMDLRYTLRMLGIPLLGSTYMFGDNQSVITQSTLPHSQLTKRHHALSYHRVREAVAAKVLQFIKIDGKDNPADIFTKPCGYQQAWPHVRVLLFYAGDTGKMVLKEGAKKV